MSRNKLKVLALLSLIAAVLVLISCTGDTDGGSAAANNGQGTNFVASDADAGSIALSVNTTSLPVADTSPFRVSVTDRNGNAVSNVSISCDTEQGLAIIEPSTGSELTDSNGHMSGIVGCETPGSYQMACRLPLGANKREFASIVCTGDAPQGFDGFGGAAGGGLGGGSVVDSDDIARDVRITSVSAFDDGSASGAGTTTIDVVQGCCTQCTADSSDDSDEPFFNTLLAIEVQNDSDSTILFNSFSYSMDDCDGTGGTFNSGTLNLVEAREVAPNSEATLVALFLNAQSGDKFCTGAGTGIASDRGFADVTVRLSGRTTLGVDVTVNGTTALDFGNFNACSAGCIAAGSC